MRKLVEVLLVGEAPGLDSVKTPLETALPPPLETRPSNSVIPDRQEADVVDAVDLPPLQMRREV